MYQRNVLTLLLILLYGGIIYSQVQRFSLEDLSESERKSIEAIALYPEDIRLAVLEVASHPATMVQIKRIQESSREDFQNLLMLYPREKQQLIWDLTRFEGLLEEIANCDQSKQTLTEITEAYPPEVRESVYDLEKEDFILIEEVLQLRIKAEEEAHALIRREEPKLQSSYRLLLDNPEVLSIMSDEMELAILVGNLYLTDRDWVLKKSDSLNLALATENSQALEDWKKSLEDDKEAQLELRASLDEYEQDYPYDDIYYDENDISGDINEENVINRISVYYLYHYPFWFGYPYWYSYPRWRPYPIWYDWGFYPYSINRSIVVFSLPRYYTVWWYLNQPRHHYRYTHLSKKIIQHHNTHREFGGGITAAVDRWQHQNHEIISDDFLVSRDLDQRLKLYGEMEENRIKYNKRNPTREISSSQYVKKYERKYEPIVPRSKARTDQPATERRERIVNDIKKVPVRTPASRKQTIEKKETIRKVDKAKEYHRNQTVKKSPVKKSAPKPAPTKVNPRKKSTEPVKKSPRNRKAS